MINFFEIKKSKKICTHDFKVDHYNEYRDWSDLHVRRIVYRCKKCDKKKVKKIVINSLGLFRVK